MPSYDMFCFSCEDIFEVRRSMSDDSAVICASCGSNQVKQAFIQVPTMFVRNIDHPDSPLDDMPNAPQMRAQADLAIRKAMKDMGMNP